MQRSIMPTSVWAVVDEAGRLSRQFQQFFGVLAQNSIPVTNDTNAPHAMMSGLVLLPDSAKLPSGWKQIDTLVIGLNTYKVIGLE
jgi:hypothetical protein